MKEFTYQEARDIYETATYGYPGEPWIHNATLAAPGSLTLDGHEVFGTFRHDTGMNRVKTTAITTLAFKVGMEYLRTRCPGCYAAIMRDDYDALDADALLQAAILGEVIFG